MAGGNKKIHEHPNAGKNDFSKRPNQAGRPKLPDLSGAIANVLEGKEGAEKALEKLMNAMYQKGLKGDVKAAEAFLDRAYGKARQTIDSNIKANAITHNINIKDGRKDH